MGKSPINIEDGEFSSKKYLGDDEDVAANSNLVIKNDREKVPPDKHSAVKANRSADLQLEGLDFVPECEILGREAASAINRARTQRCKKELVHIACLAQEGKLYPQYLKSQCPSQDARMGKSLGCYQDERQFRLLSGYFSNLKNANSPEQCIYLCLQSGFQYAGVQYSTECYCGNAAPPSAAKLPDSSCNMPCPADPKEDCGGFFTMGVFQTGLPNLELSPVKSEPDDPKAQKARVVYLLTLNGRAVRQVKRLIRALYHADHFFYIHVDARQDYMFREMLDLESKMPGQVVVARKRLATIWGGASLLEILLTSMKELLTLHEKWSWDYVINLSESDFPLKHNDRLVQFLTANNGRNFVKSFGKEVQRFIQKQGLDKTFHECEAHMWRVGDRVLPWGIQMDGGSDWIALSYKFAKFVSSGEDDELLKGLKTLFKQTLLPAESFFHTALRNSEFCDTYVDNNLHITNWRRKLGCRCQYRHVVDWCGCSPNDFKPSDWARIKGTDERQVFFARKFEPIINQAIIKQLEEWIFGLHSPDTPSIDSYWQSVFDHRDQNPSSDDTFKTAGSSFSRISARMLCKIQLVKTLEINLYFHEDAFMGFLVKYQAKNLTENDKTSFTIETRFKPKSTTKIHSKETPFASRIESFIVSSDFDVKEMVSRNPMRVLGPFSQPTAIVQLSSGPALEGGLNATVMWTDPIGWLADITEIHILETAQTLSSKLTLKPPIRPGAWSAKIVTGSKVVAETQFLVMPLEFMSGVEVSSNQAEYVNSGPNEPYIVQKANSLSHVVHTPESSVVDSLLRKAAINSKRLGVDLQDWVDSSVERFYTLQSSCIVESASLGKGCPSVKLCHTKSWSSHYPDPKSYIGGVDFTTGQLI
ncbi:Hypothetical predicted protein [Cloeon dipterum]|uniref:protein xylosyltransferase n=1 Tax=Cloeon dipterum TaxID=197152 RepID=A0A8S1D114_9INSE|nr:Hypothetical predicted protein [Cloeon dipterum]